MKEFIYKAKDGPDKVIKGRMPALNTREVVDTLAQKGLVAILVKEPGEDSKNSAGLSRYFPEKIGLKENVLFTKELANLLKSGVPMLRALNILSQQASNRGLKKVIEDVSDCIRQGEPLSSALRKYPKAFSPFYTAMVKSGEDSGTLNTALRRIADYYLKHLELLSKVRAALTYPLLILFVGAMTLVFIFTHVMPKIIPLLVSLNIRLPLPTKILIGISRFFQHNWMGFLLGLAIVILIFNRALKSRIFQKSLSCLKLRLPLFGKLIFKSEFTRFCRALETSLRSGIPIIEAMEISIPVLNEEGIRESLSKGRKELESGGSLGMILKKSKIFSPFVFNLILIGEESGRMGEALSEIASAFEEDCEEYIKTFTTLLEPVMVLIMGLLVGFIVSAVLLPIFELQFMQM